MNTTFALRTLIHVLLPFIVTTSIGEQQPETRTGTVEGIVGEVLQTSRSPAGLEVARECSQPAAGRYQVVPGDPDQSLRLIAERDSTVAWRKIGNIYQVSISGAHALALGSLRVPRMTIKTVTTFAAGDAVLRNFEVKEQISALRFEQLTDQIGGSSINEREERVINIPAGSLRTALNTIAVTFGAAVWKLDERTCGDHRGFRITWIAH